MNFLWNASAMKGLWHLASIFPRLKAIRPEAKLYVISDAEVWMKRLRWSHNIQGYHMHLIYRDLFPYPGVYNLGPLSVEQCDELPQMDAVLFPCDPVFQIAFTKEWYERTLQAYERGAPLIASQFPDVKECFPLANFLEVPIWYEAWIQMLSLPFERRIGHCVPSLRLQDLPEFSTE